MCRPAGGFASLGLAVEQHNAASNYMSEYACWTVSILQLAGFVGDICTDSEDEQDMPPGERFPQWNSDLEGSDLGAYPWQGRVFCTRVEWRHSCDALIGVNLRG